MAESLASTPTPGPIDKSGPLKSTRKKLNVSHCQDNLPFMEKSGEPMKAGEGLILWWVQVRRPALFWALDFQHLVSTSKSPSCSSPNKDVVGQLLQERARLLFVNLFIKPEQRNRPAPKGKTVATAIVVSC